MKNAPRHILPNARALWLAVLLFVAFGSKEAHHFAAHRHDAPVKICREATTDEQHFHNEEYLSHDCSLCDFTFSFFTFSLPTICFKQPQVTLSTSNFTFLNCRLSANAVRARGRAPPVVRVIG